MVYGNRETDLKIKRKRRPLPLSPDQIEQLLLALWDNRKEVSHPGGGGGGGSSEKVVRVCPVVKTPFSRLPPRRYF